LRKILLQAVEYYDDEGKTLKNFFLKTPIKFSRITSRFTMQRFHPVQHRWKAQKELIMQPYRNSYYHNSVVEKQDTRLEMEITLKKHNGTYSTQYLHMSKKYWCVEACQSR
jgi:murein DD-endopeptidase MepM/ murein hydrolase activator NlpD